MQVSDIITQLGGASEAARRLGLKRTTIAMWRKRDCVPPRHAWAVAHALGVPAETIRPDLSARPQLRAA